MTDDQIKHMVNRFLNWKLPEHFNPDAGISFKAEYNDSPAAMRMLGLTEPMKHEPIGTNLFDAIQAEAMVRHMIEGMPTNEVTASRKRLPSILMPLPSRSKDASQ